MYVQVLSLNRRSFKLPIFQEGKTNTPKLEHAIVNSDALLYRRSIIGIWVMPALGPLDQIYKLGPIHIATTILISYLFGEATHIDNFCRSCSSAVSPQISLVNIMVIRLNDSWC